MNYHIPRIMLAAPASGGGKTTVTCGLLQALLNRGVSPAAFKCGPDYIDPMFHKYVLGVDGGNLDSFFLGEHEIRRQLVLGSGQQDMAVIEGVMGYFDGVAGTSTWASSYDVARITETPVILIVDCKGSSLSVAAVVQGFLQYEKDLAAAAGKAEERENTGELSEGRQEEILGEISGEISEKISGSRIKGVLLNRISPVMAERLKPEIEKLGVTVVGYIPECPEMKLESRHLGLVKPEELDMLRSQLDMLAEQMKNTVNIDKICSIAQSAPDIEMADEGLEEIDGGQLKESEGTLKKRVKRSEERKKECRSSQPLLRIGVARDSAFCFYYQENLLLLESMGVETVMFSPISDTGLPPNLDGMILGGGYPELHAAELASNTSMRESIKTAIEAGMPYLAECGGFLYLHRELESSDGVHYPMVGVIDGNGYRTKRLSRFGYITLTPKAEEHCLSNEIKGHEFHYWDSTENGAAFNAQKPATGRSWTCGFAGPALYAAFPHLYFAGRPQLAERFVRAAAAFQSGR